jgi:hypothetical protein
MPEDFRYDVFLSHNHADKPQVRRLVPVSQLSTLNSQPARTAVHRDPANAGRRFIPLRWATVLSRIRSGATSCGLPRGVRGGVCGSAGDRLALVLQKIARSNLRTMPVCSMAKRKSAW